MQDTRTNKYVRTGVAGIDKVGVAASIITTDRRALYRGLFLPGEIISREPPIYLFEAAVLHGLGVLHSWIRAPEEGRAKISSIHGKAGNRATVNAPAKWRRAGELSSQSQIASPLAGDFYSLEHWIRAVLRIHASALSALLGDVKRMPWRSEEILNITEEFRLHALKCLGTQ